MTGKNAIVLEQPGLLTVARSKVASEFKCRKVVREGRRLFVLAALASATGFYAWASQTELTSVTRAGGTVVPPDSNQIVQHFEGGIVTQILVREGDRVARGDTLLRLEDSRWTAAMAQTQVELGTKQVQRARLEAEANGAETFEPPVIDGIRKAATTEKLLFDRRRSSLKERTAVYEDQIRRFRLELRELEARKENLASERLLVGERVASLRRLAVQKAVSRNELLSALTTLQQLETKIADAENQIPQVQAELEETEKRKNELSVAAQVEAAALLADMDLEIAKLEEQITSLRDREVRSDVRAPVAGVVNKLLVNTLGGVVSPGQEVVEIVPDSEALVVSARLAPSDRGKVWSGMPAILKITAYDYSIHGGLDAVIEEISADVISNEDGESFFRVRLTAEKSDLGPGYPILPGMVADVDMLAEDKTVLQTLIEPLTEIRDTALRE